MIYFRKNNFFELNVQKTFLFLLIIFIIKVIAIINSPLSLSVDEAQYWDWSNKLMFGYFSKPPLIAWLIGFTTYFFGIAEWSVRLSSPIIHLLISFIIWFISKSVYNIKVANFITLIWATLPLISFGSLIISTDTPLLLFWCISLFTLLKTLESNKFIWPTLLGMSIGLGFLTKYAALYFIVILFFLIIFNHRFKKNILKFILTICIFLLVSAPNVYWNYENDLSTFSHTAYNANLNVISLNYFEPMKFIGSQLVICGPIILLAYLLKVINFKSYNKNEFLLICFSLPILILIIVQAFLKTSNANWAATAFPGIVILIGSFIYNQKNKIILLGIKLNLLINVGIFFLLIKIFMTGQLNPIYLKSDPLRKLKGYSEQSKVIKSYLDYVKPSALIFSRRNDITKFSYHLKLFENKEIKRYYLTARKNPINHYEYNYNFKDHSLEKKDVVLIISSLDGIDKQYIKYFDTFETIGKTVFKKIDAFERNFYIIKATIK